MHSLILMLVVQSSSATCPADLRTLRADVQAASQAYDDWAWEEFDRLVAQVEMDIGCLVEVVGVPDAKAVHRLFALAGSRKKDGALSEFAFRAMLSLEPTYVLDQALAPKGSLLRQAWESARKPMPGDNQHLPTGVWFLDGQPDPLELPRDRLAVVQLLEGNTLHSWYVDGRSVPVGISSRLHSWPPEDVQMIPSFLSAPNEARRSEVASVRESPQAPKPRHLSRGLLGAGLSVAAAGVGGLLLGEYCQAMMANTSNESVARNYYNEGFVVSISGVALGATGTGLVVAALIKGQW